MRGNRGFSLVELILVVAVIGIIAAIAIPNLLASRRAANEASVASALRTVYGANFCYASSIGNGDYAGLPATVGTSSLTDLASARLIDTLLAGGEKSGYFIVGDRTMGTANEAQSFYFAANPVTPSGVLMTGTKRFGVATDGVIRYDGTLANLSVPFDATTLPAATPFPQ